MAGLVALSVLARDEPRRNIADFLGSRPMGPNEDWPEIRVRATLAAQARINVYANERSERLRVYELNWRRTNLRLAR